MAALTLKLSGNATLVRRSFAQWHGILKAGADEIDSATQIGGTDVRFRPITHHHPKLHLEFWVGSSESAAVQINQPRVAGSLDPGSTIALDAKGRRHLIRQGDLHGNRQSERIRGAQFRERTGLDPVVIENATSPAGKEWFVVARLDGMPPASIRRSTADFVRRCWSARTFGQQAAVDQERLRSLFGKPERGGWFDVDPPATPTRVLRVQGFVSEQLEELLSTEGITIAKPRHAANYEVDGAIETSAGPVLLEIKTGISAADVYGGVGQLTLYPVLLPDLAGHARILLLPGKPGAKLVEALGDCGVELHSYELRRGRRKAMARFTAAFLRRCGMSECRTDELVASGAALP